MNNCINDKYIKNYFSQIVRLIEERNSCILVGSIKRITGMKLEAIGITASVGTLCKIIVSEKKSINAEVIGFSDNLTYLMATENIHGIRPGTRVISLSQTMNVCVGSSLLGRVLDADGKPFDGRSDITAEEYYPLVSKPINPFARRRITEALDVGVRSINALLTIGKGQRMGIFSGSGVGKSVLLGMMTRFTKATVVVVGLVGERGREVKDFIEHNLGEYGLKRAVVIAAPADTSPLLRIHCANRAMAIAEYFRDKGCDVLLLIDSLTRYAQAHREITLSVGELPATKGFTPSVFAKISNLVERSGNGIGEQGSITAFYTVLVEGDDPSDPIADHVRSVLDGHIYLSRKLAEAGSYPAIDIERSISRLMPTVVKGEQVQKALKFKQLYSAYMQNKDLINVGMYQPGSDKVVDEAIKYKNKMMEFMTQSSDQSVDMELSIETLENIFDTAES